MPLTCATSSAPAPASVSVPEAAKALGVPESTLRYQLRRDSTLGFRRFGRWRVRSEAIERLLAEEAEGPKAA
jgi:hypothetical protein